MWEIEKKLKIIVENIETNNWNKKLEQIEIKIEKKSHVEKFLKNLPDKLTLLIVVLSVHGTTTTPASKNFLIGCSSNDLTAFVWTLLVTQLYTKKLNESHIWKNINIKILTSTVIRLSTTKFMSCWLSIRATPCPNLWAPQ